MGWRISWLAVRGKPAADVLNELGLRGTGEPGYIADTPIVGGHLPDGRYLIVANRSDFVDDLPLERLSAGAEVVTCWLSSTVMVSSADGWADGKRVWSAWHDPEDGADNLDTEGTLPAAFAPIRDRLKAAQAKEGGDEAEVDHLFDVPIELAKAVTGFRHDETYSDKGEMPFEMLRVSQPRQLSVRTQKSEPAIPNPDPQASAGMSAFGDTVLFLGIFGLAALPATGAALFFRRGHRRFGILLSVLSLALAATGIASVIARFTT